MTRFAPKRSMSMPVQGIDSAPTRLNSEKANDTAGAAGVKIHSKRLEKYTEGKDDQWRAKEEADGTHENNQPSVEKSRPLAGHSSKLRPRDGEYGRGHTRVAWALGHVRVVLEKLYVPCARSQGKISPVIQLWRNPAPAAWLRTICPSLGASSSHRDPECRSLTSDR